MTTASTRGGSRRLVASYPTYGEAQRAVDTLSDRKFPVEQVTIVGSDLRLVERVTGRLTVPRAAFLGAAAGAWIGLLIGDPPVPGDLSVPEHRPRGGAAVVRRVSGSRSPRPRLTRPARPAGPDPRRWRNPGATASSRPAGPVTRLPPGR